MSKYIGETENNLEQIVGATGQAAAVLLSGEADALIGKRDGIRDSYGGN